MTKIVLTIGVLGLAVTGLGFAQDAVWVHEGKVTTRGREVIQLLEQAATKGLDPWDYVGPLWALRLGAVELREPQDLQSFDMALTEAAMKYVSDLREGRANPGVYRVLDRSSTPLSLLVQKNVVEAADLSAGLQSIEPPFPAYGRTMAALEVYRMLARSDDGERLPVISKPVEPGDDYAGVPRLNRLLRALGDLPSEAAIPADSLTYSGAAVEAVKRFQTRHGLEADGRIGKATLAQLNVPLIDRVRQLELALERWRWLPRDLSGPSVWVNLPEFRLRAFDSTHQLALEMKIVAGTPRTPTPQLAGNLSEVIFRPYWNVPYSILRHELLPEIKRRPGYLAANQYEVTTSRGQVVTSSAVSSDTFTRLRSGEFQMRQVPGAKNALGLVKFMFPNEASVYLHDTPAKTLFAKVRRAFSHGCVRLENAPEFARWTLQGEQDWPREQVNAALTGTKTIAVNLKRPIPLMITYITAVVLDNGEVRFLEDLYGYDAALEKQLAATSGARGRRPRE